MPGQVVLLHQEDAEDPVFARARMMQNGLAVAYFGHGSRDKRWSVTHVGSGRALFRGATFEAARAMYARFLATDVDWTMDAKSLRTNRDAVFAACAKLGLRPE